VIVDALLRLERLRRFETVTRARTRRKTAESIEPLIAAKGLASGP